MLLTVSSNHHVIERRQALIRSSETMICGLSVLTLNLGRLREAHGSAIRIISSAAIVDAEPDNLRTGIRTCCSDAP